MHGTESDSTTVSVVGIGPPILSSLFTSCETSIPMPSPATTKNERVAIKPRFDNNADFKDLACVTRSLASLTHRAKMMKVTPRHNGQ